MDSENGGTPGWVSGPDEAPAAAATGSSNRKRGLIAGATLIAAGGVAGAILTGTLSAGAATTPTPSPATGSTASDPADDAHPGDNGADGVPEAQEHHGRGGHGGGDALDLSGTVTAVGSTSVTIKTSTATTTYTVDSSSDIDKSGEAKLADVKVGDAVTFSVTGTTIEKLHAGDETKNVPTPDAADPSDTPDTSSGA